MGTPLEDEPTGTMCGSCFSPGKPFFALRTPIFLKVILSNWTEGEYWVPADEGLLLQPHYLTQQSDPCYWLTEDDIFFWGVAWFSPLAAMRVWRKSDFRSAFNIHSTTPCLLQYPDGNVVWDDNVAYDGTLDIEFEEVPV
jgi:hypothetical protein